MNPGIIHFVSKYGLRNLEKIMKSSKTDGAIRHKLKLVIDEYNRVITKAGGYNNLYAIYRKHSRQGAFPESCALLKLILSAAKQQEWAYVDLFNKSPEVLKSVSISKVGSLLD